jgi:riboflavin kinase/FMN adenylyltransferase
MVVAATGFFDGVHRGHRAVLEQVRQIASSRGKYSAVVTFWPHPRAVLQQDAQKFRLLTTLKEKESIMYSLGIDKVYVLPFDKEFAKQTTAEFFENYLVKKFNVSVLVAGYDHRVGSDVHQTQSEMFDIARNCGIEPVRVGEFENTEGHVVISSTKIRESLRSGEMERASSMLGYDYSLEGAVVEGKKIGRSMGFPTANMKLYEPLKLLPADGVYAVKVHVVNKSFIGITNIGTRPTVSMNGEKSIETHILDFDEDIYGLPLRVEFVERLREEVKFSSIEMLRQQLCKDSEKARVVLER